MIAAHISDSTLSVTSTGVAPEPPSVANRIAPAISPNGMPITRVTTATMMLVSTMTPNTRQKAPR